MGPLTQLLLSVLLLPSVGLLRPIAVAGEIQAQATEADHLSAEVAKLYEEGKYDQAIPLAQRELKMRESQHGHDSLPTAVSLSRLATLYFALKEYGAAELNYRESLAVYDRLNEGNNLNVAKITDRLAFLSYQKQDYAQTETFYLRSLAIRETAREPGNTNLIQSMSNLAQFYRTVGKYDKATSIYERMLVIRACAVSGPKVFYSGSEAAALKARFTPTLKNGGATKAVGLIMYKFETR
jgi:tetratricopeptide (TPR) repeat protein